MNARGLHPDFLELAAARLDALLDAAEQARLDAHLATCDPCRERVAAYEADRLALRTLRPTAPPPPRDLWARTSAALDREARAAGSGLRTGVGLPRRWIPLGSTPSAYGSALAVLLIVALVGSGIVPGLVGPVGPSFVATATPLAVEPGRIAYVSTRDGEVGVYMGRIDSVCPEAFQANCQPIDSDVTKVASFANDFVAEQLAVSPDGKHGAVVGTSTNGGAVYAVRFPELSGPSPRPTQTASLGPTPATTASTEPTSPIGTEIPSASLPPVTGEPEAIIDHVIVVGEPPAYSADGAMLAFSAMPADGSAGPDIYVWRIEDQTMDRLTDDGGSIFASWAGAEVVGSRGEPDASGDAAAPVSFVLDPATGTMRELAQAAWRPIVDPTGRNVIFWDGALASSAQGLLWQEHQGGLYLAPWSLFDPAAKPFETPSPGPESTPTATSPTSPGGHASAKPGATAPGNGAAAPSAELSTQPPTGGPGKSPATAPSARASESPTASGPAATPIEEPLALLTGRDYEADPVVSWEARWSADGEWYGAWIGDPRSGAHPETGSLTVGAVDRATGRIDAERTQLDGAPAVRGFALGNHRIAWATLPGADGKSEVRVLVWTDAGRGIVRTTPGGYDTLPAL